MSFHFARKVFITDSVYFRPTKAVPLRSLGWAACAIGSTTAAIDGGSTDLKEVSRATESSRNQVREQGSVATATCWVKNIDGENG